MAELRIRIELQRASKGIEMSKLAALAEETQKFLRMVAEDAGLDPNAGTWVAQDFYNQGVGFNAEYQYADIDGAQADVYLHLVDDIAQVEPANAWNVPRVRPLTVLQSARVAKLADDGETVRVGFINGDAAPLWRPLAKARAVAIIEHFEAFVEYRGMLQGVIHSLFKEANPPYFTLRDFASRELVKCEFRASEWDRIHRALERKDGVVLVAGWVRTKRIDRSIVSLRVDRIEGTKALSVNQLRDLFGSAPGWAGDLTSDEFIARIREESNGE